MMRAQDSGQGTSAAAHRPPRQAGVWSGVGYSAMVLCTIGAFLLIRAYGERLVAPPAAPVTSFADAPAQPAQVLVHVLVALAAVIVTGQLLAKLLASLRQPPVIGEVVAGILLGPSLLGPELSGWILPPAVAPFLGLIAQLGVILYMFLVGLELNTGLLTHRVHATVATSHASILVPFLLGTLLALALYPRLSDRSVPFTSFALFLGVAMAITAFPVLARILTARGMTRTELGVVALGCAAIDDVTAWCLLAFVVGIARAEVGQGLLVTAGALGYLAGMLLIARPLLRRVAAQWTTDPLPRGTAAGVFVALLLSALTAEVIGIHAVFGAFLLGAVIPSESVVARTLTRQLEHLVTVLLLPTFFAFTGMRTRIDLVSGLEQWVICGLIILTATLGKFGGTLVAARLTGMGWRAAAALGTLMNTRGLMELIVLNVGLDLRVISPPLFAMMVVMALVTTMATAPVLWWLQPQTAAPPAPERARATHEGQTLSSAGIQRRQAEGPSRGHQK
jgi:Kef-type K+ transport system membrane component KefB